MPIHPERPRPVHLIYAFLALGFVAGCQSQNEDPPVKKNNAGPGDVSVTMKLTSSAFATDGKIPQRHSGDGEDRSPPLSWSNVPPGTKQFALICDDPDAPGDDPWVHWVIYGIGADVSSLPDGVADSPTLQQPEGARQGKNSWSSGQTIGYRGPAPPPGDVHHYHFTLYALDKELDLEPGLDKSELLAAMEGRVLAEGKLVGTYQKK